MKSKTQTRLSVLSLATALLLAHAAAPGSLRADDPVGDFAISRSDFAGLYNGFRFAQPKNVPWAGSYWGYAGNGIAIVPNGQPDSPAARFDRQFGLGTVTTDFEKAQHSCDHVPASSLEACQGWFGHCNAWSAAAVKESEPNVSVQLGDAQFTVADQKAYLTEMWMETGAMFAGTTNKGQTTGDWVTDPNSAIGAQINSSGLSNYDSFWDVTPRNFFTLFTNYIGVLQVGVVIDRFTGDQVWNQPAAGYRILPLRADDLGSDVKDGKTVYFARMRMKIYWASDDVDHGYVSSKFDITATTDDETPDYFPANDYSARLLKFRLFFDAPVVLDAQGQVASAGNMIGKGIWGLQEVPPSDLVFYDHDHPDFIWMPTGFHGSTGYGNPTLTPDRVYRVAQAPAVSLKAVPVNPVPGPSVAPSPAPVTGAPIAAGTYAGAEGEVTTLGVRHLVKVMLSGFTLRGAPAIQGTIFHVLSRADIQSYSRVNDLRFVGDHVELPMIFPDGQTPAQITAALVESGFQSAP